MIDNLFLNYKGSLTDGLFDIAADGFFINGADDYTVEEKSDGKSFVCEKNGLLARADFEFCGDVLVRKDSVTNVGKTAVTLHRYFARFGFFGNDYEVYTQRNVWQNENVGEWQKLNTGVFCETSGTRHCDGASPVMCLKNEQNGSVISFNIVPNCKWKAFAKVFAVGGTLTDTVLGLGFDDDGLAFPVAPGQTVSLPEIIIVQSKNDVDFDAYKLHRYVNAHRTQKQLPVLYNSWLCNFDAVDFENLKAQADVCKKIGVEYFVVDAGWFGEKGCWSELVGDWQESKTGALEGRLSELSDYVHSLGMKFGLWTEPQRARTTSNSFKTHPDYYIDVGGGDALLDFANEKAVDHIFGLISGVITKYNLDFMKFDYNSTANYDVRHTAFYDYQKGQKAFFERIRKTFPDLYTSSCASGGMNTSLASFEYSDSFWISDNQGPIDGLRIYKDFVKRMPPCAIEKWNVQAVAPDIPVYGSEKGADTVLNCNDATWTSLAKVSDSYALNFLTGGPLGFSCDMTVFSEDYLKTLKDFIAQYKVEREFFRTAACKILCDRENVVVFEYFNDDFSQITVQIFTKTITQYGTVIFPAVNENAVYEVEGRETSGKDISTCGIKVENLHPLDCKVLKLVAKK